MTSNEEKKQHERFLLDRFLEHQEITPTSIDAEESPDFLITLDGRVVGIEVTELFIQRCSSETRLIPVNPLLQAIESTSTKIVSKAREIYFDTDNPPVLAHIVFSNRITPVDKRTGDHIALLIADQIQSMSRQDSKGAEWRSREDEKEDNPLSGWVSFISTWRVSEPSSARWSPNSAGIVSTLTPARLQEEVDIKASKINVYKQHAEEIWLLIVVDRTRSSQKFSVEPNFPLHSISSPFARTFYYDLVHNKVLSFETLKVQTVAERERRS